MKDGFWWQPKKSSTFWSLMCILPLTNATWWKKPWALKAVWNNKGRIWEPIWLDKHCSTSYIFLKMLASPVIDLAPLVAMKTCHICLQLPYIEVKLDYFLLTMMKSPCHRHFETLTYMDSSTYSNDSREKREKTLHNGGIFIFDLIWHHVPLFVPILLWGFLSLLLWIWSFKVLPVDAGRVLSEFFEATSFSFFFFRQTFARLLPWKFNTSCFTFLQAPVRSCSCFAMAHGGSYGEARPMDAPWDIPDALTSVHWWDVDTV